MADFAIGSGLLSGMFRTGNDTSISAARILDIAQAMTHAFYADPKRGRSIQSRRAEMKNDCLQVMKSIVR
ncbi:hypothetical protein [Salinisphaera hydrothermalis]|uniref:hypothetical protein n=1 Tax=Salinisphaera hydrothermalis TaxID=563188 RepID=UPI00055BF717|nr:hypothetical protein [Salinisphaera hydrothermalis]